jgi:two-component system capsular synthesis sensor histidine kinase RcsC
VQNFSKKTDAQSKEIPKIKQESGKFKKCGKKLWLSTLNEMRRKQILIVDDDEKLRNLLSSMITMMGFEAASAKSGDEALDHFKKNPIDLVITDLNMPGMDGWSFARHIKGLSPDTPVVLSTAEVRKCILEKAEESSVDLVLFKPFGFGEFQKMVQKMLRIT